MSKKIRKLLLTSLFLIALPMCAHAQSDSIPIDGKTLQRVQRALIEVEFLRNQIKLEQVLVENFQQALDAERQRSDLFGRAYAARTDEAQELREGLRKAQEQLALYEKMYQRDTAALAQLQAKLNRAERGKKRWFAVAALEAVALFLLLR